MQKFHTAVIGAGASGLVAAISAGRSGNQVVICERLPVIGKKLLACGGGRCNFLNESLNSSYYNQSAKGLVDAVLERFGKEKILDFFLGLGVHHYSEEGRIFPVTNQSSTVMRCLEIEIKRLGIPVELGYEVSGISEKEGSFQLVSSQNKKLSCEYLILAAGGRSYPELGSDGSCYKFCRAFGHRVVEPVPSAVAVETDDKSRHLLQGQKIFVCAKSLIDGKILSESRGELLFTKYGLSGPAILDISQELSVALNRQPRRKAQVKIDLVPFLDARRLRDELEGRMRSGFPEQDLLCGILPDRFSRALPELAGSKDPARISSCLKERIFNVVGTRGWGEAEFTCGGVDTGQVDPGTLGSKLKNKLYFCGEILDVEGKRGGYNLAWAFASGFIAGLTE